MDVFRQRRDWFEQPTDPMFVMWRVPDGHRPSLAESADRLGQLRSEGPSDTVFMFANVPRTASGKSTANQPRNSTKV